MLFGVITGLAVGLAALICGGNGAFADGQWVWMLPVGLIGCWLGLAILALVFFVLMVERIDPQVPQEHDSPFYRRMTAWYISFIKIVARIRVQTQGLEQIPKEGRFMLVCNHLNDSDPAILLHYFSRSGLIFISKQENRTMFVVGKLMHKLRCQLLNRENDREALRCIRKCIQMIETDQASVAVFPEGYVSKGRNLLPLRSGVFRIAQRTGVPIVVCTLQGTENVMHNLKRLRPTTARLHLVAVIPKEEIVGKTTVEIAGRVRTLMRQDLDPEYRGEE